MDTIQKIGKLTIDESHYPGEDLYCDGTVEDELLEIAKNASTVEYPAIIEEKKSWPILYHLSSQRENIVNWLPFKKDMKVLEIGSGCGAITGALSRMAGSVTCVELSKKRSLVNAYRHEDCDNVTIKLGNFQDVEPELEKNYDCALLIGVLEYGASYIGGDAPFDTFIKTVRRHVKKTGTIVIAIENRFGLKYWAGCREDHIGDFFSSLEGYPEGGCATTFSHKELEEICKKAGEKKIHFYYPYPDYKFMTTLYSDDCLPKVGELINNNRNFDRDRMKLFQESLVYDGIIKEGNYPFFANSFLVVLGNKPETEYIRYSNDRAPEYQISTEILKTEMPCEETGEPKKQRVVKKHALCRESRAHVQNMVKMEPLLRERYNDDRLEVNRILAHDEESVTFAFETGTTLTEKLDALLREDDVEGFTRLFLEYVDRVGKNSQMLITDYDVVFSNILIQGNQWKLLDYEWTSEKQTPVKELAFRALYCYLLEDESRNKFNFDSIFEELGITPEQAESYRELELRFQREVTGKRKSMPELRDMIGGAVIVPQKTFNRAADSQKKSRIQIYLDRGNGYSEEDAFFLEEGYDGDGKIETTFMIPSETKELRIDPCMDACIVEIQEISLNGERLPLLEHKFLTSNGKELFDKERDSATLIFGNTDPGFSVRVSDRVLSTGNEVFLRMKTTYLAVETAELIEKELKKKIRL